MDWQPHADATTAVFIFFPTSGGLRVGEGKEGTTSPGKTLPPVFDCLFDILPKHHEWKVRLAVLVWNGSLTLAHGLFCS